MGIRTFATPRSVAAIRLMKNLYRAKGLASAIAPELEKKIDKLIKKLASCWEKDGNDLNVLVAYDFAACGVRTINKAWPPNASRLLDSESMEDLNEIKRTFQYVGETALHTLDELDRARSEKNEGLGGPVSEVKR